MFFFAKCLPSWPRNPVSLKAGREVSQTVFRRQNSEGNNGCAPLSAWNTVFANKNAGNSLSPAFKFVKMAKKRRFVSTEREVQKAIGHFPLKYKVFNGFGSPKT